MDEPQGNVETDAQARKREKDAGRIRRGTIHRKRIHVLQNPTKLAFRGWENAPEPWAYSTCERFIEWCHIGKKFPLHRHHANRTTNKANLKYCLCPEFVQRCLEVIQFLYEVPIPNRSEAPLFVCRMVYAELVLRKVVDWRMIKHVPGIKCHPKEVYIPKGVLKFPEGVIKRFDNPNEHGNEVAVVWSASEDDSDSDGRQVRKVSTTKAAEAARMSRLRKREPALAESLVTATRRRTSSTLGASIATNIGVGNGTPDANVDTL